VRLFCNENSRGGNKFWLFIANFFAPCFILLPDTTLNVLKNACHNFYLYFNSLHFIIFWLFVQ
jgi:hypothetical protein